MKKQIIKFTFAFILFSGLYSCTSTKSGCYDFSYEAPKEIDNTHNEPRVNSREYCLD